MSRQKTKKKKVYGPGEIIWIVVLVLLAVIILYPLFWIIMSSFKDYAGIYGDVWGMPDVWHFENYSLAWNRGISQYFVNSAIVTVCTIIGVVLVSTFAAFGICQMKGKLGNILFLICMCGLLLSPQVCLLPLFMLLKSMGIKNTLSAMILPYIAFRLPVSIMLIRSFFVGISKEMQEAAIIDGAGLMKIYTNIYLPLSKPIISTVVIMTAYYAWNEFVFATIFVDSSNMRTIPVGLMAFRDGLMTEWGVVLAGMVIACLPIVVLFLFMQKSFVRGMTAGAVKG
ncbi:carbohydrate ABC transporter permease [Blautia liquoris]|jgi:raffinose/stachyose/melibiose transport system permease protein|uniref:Carbohydrate ABC transporter permease n=1 Tax=Blautia liquoris TaxID=2779518 RepID=A0A7M2RFU5_9FIRM|nr:carbohydrate ABC transporter permease [Blautia liquoris]QOV19129.1 carbohydrate ABC transporter permease [Blautia liquoris]